MPRGQVQWHTGHSLRRLCCRLSGRSILEVADPHDTLLILMHVHAHSHWSESDFCLYLSSHPLAQRLWRKLFGQLCLLPFGKVQDKRRIGRLQRLSKRLHHAAWRHRSQRMLSSRHTHETQYRSCDVDVLDPLWCWQQRGERRIRVEAGRRTAHHASQFNVSRSIACSRFSWCVGTEERHVLDWLPKHSQ